MSKTQSRLIKSLAFLTTITGASLGVYFLVRTVIAMHS